MRLRRSPIYTSEFIQIRVRVCLLRFWSSRLEFFDFRFFYKATCMTWELAELGKHFISTIINGSDLVPTFSTALIDDLHSEVTSSSWYNNLLDQIKHTRVLNVFYRSTTALGSRLPTMASARERVANVSALLCPVSSSTQASSMVQLNVFEK
ncbi:hypothetical protein AgCh_022914 [Apium graveolens]